MKTAISKKRGPWSWIIESSAICHICREQSGKWIFQRWRFFLAHWLSRWLTGLRLQSFLFECRLHECALFWIPQFSLCVFSCDTGPEVIQPFYSSVLPCPVFRRRAGQAELSSPGAGVQFSMPGWKTPALHSTRDAQKAVLCSFVHTRTLIKPQDVRYWIT